MSFSFIPLLLVVTASTGVCLSLDDILNSNSNISNNNISNNDDKPQISWTCFNDIIQALQSPHPTVETSSFGRLTYRLQRTHESNEKDGKRYAVWRGYDIDNEARSVVVSTSDFIRGSFFSDMHSKSVTMEASPQKFTLEYEEEDDKPTKNMTCCSNHTAGTTNTTSSSDDSRVFRARSSDNDHGFRPYEGDGTAGGVRVTMPDIRTYRIVYGTYRDYANGVNGGFEHSVIVLTETINIIYERDLGIHLIYVGHSISEHNLDSRNNEFSGIFDLTSFFTRTIGVENYDVGLYMKTSSNYGGLCVLSGILSHVNKGNCISDYTTTHVAHELGHLFGCPHPHAGQYSLVSETGRGSSIMGYGNIRDNFGVPSMMQVTRTFESSEKWTKEFHSAKNTNNLPQVDTSLLEPEYHIPHSTQFRFIVDGNDPDEEDTLQYYVSQVNFLKAKEPRSYDMRHLLGSYMTKLDGEPRVASTGISSHRTFYFGPCYKVHSAPYTAAEIIAKGKKTATYDMFVVVYDWNTQKREAYFKKLDEVVTSNMRKMIENRGNTAMYQQLNATMWHAIHSIEEKPWASTRSTYHTKVIAHSDYTPFTLDIEPKKKVYSAGERVVLKWNYDSRIIGEDDHVTLRFSRNTYEGVRCSYPYILKSHIRASDKTITINMPMLETADTSGFFMIEHDEGITYATTSTAASDTKQDPSDATIGALAITGATSAQAKIHFSFYPSSPFVVLNSSMLQTQLARYNVGGSGFPRSFQKTWRDTFKFSYLFADPTGVVLGQYNNFTDGTNEIMTHLQTHKGKYCLLAALVYYQDPFTVVKGVTNIYDLAYESYQPSGVEKYHYVTNTAEIKLRSAEKIRAPVPLRLMAEAEWNSHTDEDNDGSNEQGGGGNNNPGEGGSNNNVPEEGGDNNNGNVPEEGNDDSNNNNGDNNNNQPGNNNNHNGGEEQDGGNNEEDAGSRTDADNTEEYGVFVDVMHGCEEGCNTCTGKTIRYIADSLCHNVNNNNNNGQDYHSYKATSCSGEVGESLDVQVFPEADCQGTPQPLSLPSSCVADTVQ